MRQRTFCCHAFIANNNYHLASWRHSLPAILASYPSLDVENSDQTGKTSAAPVANTSLNICSMITQQCLQLYKHIQTHSSIHEQRLLVPQASAGSLSSELSELHLHAETDPYNFRCRHTDSDVTGAAKATNACSCHRKLLRIQNVI